MGKVVRRREFPKKKNDVLMYRWVNAAGQDGSGFMVFTITQRY